MNERKETRGPGNLPLSASGRGQGGGVGDDPEEARLRALYAEAYVPVVPSEDLRQRVAELTAPRDDPEAPRRGWWGVPWIRWAPAAALSAASVLAILGLMLSRGNHDTAREPGVPRTAQRPAAEQIAPVPHRTPHLAKNERAPGRASSRPVFPQHADEMARTAHQPLTGHREATRPHHSIPIAGARPRVAVAVGRTGVRRDRMTRRGWPMLLSRRNWDQIETRLRHELAVRDDFVQIVFPRLADASDRGIATAVENYRREAAVVDPRLSCEVTLQEEATALSDLCERLRSDTGIQLAAGPSVADEKVTLLCQKQSLREVMRQLSRPFGYTWLRSGKAGEYKYELVQDLRSQLLEEELRNRDRNAALLALDREMQRYRPYLGLSPEEALTRATTAAPAEKHLLEKLIGFGWGPIQMYFRLAPRDLAALRAGRKLDFSGAPKPDEQPLQPDLAQQVLRRLSDGSLRIRNGGFGPPEEKDAPDGLLPAAAPEARAVITLRLDRSELGQVSLVGGSGVRLTTGGGTTITTTDLAVGMSPAVRNPANAAANAALADDPALRSHVTVRPRSSCRPVGPMDPSPSPSHLGARASRPQAAKMAALPGGTGSGGGVNKVTTADVLEALHRACNLPIVADSYTRLYPISAVSVQNLPLYETLNRLADGMRVRWSKTGNWLQFRSASYYDDRLKEIPNRLLDRWVASRRQHGALTLDDLAEIAQLSDAQLDSAVVHEAARDCLGLKEWDLIKYEGQRPHLRLLASLTPGQRQAAVGAGGLPFSRMSLAQQQQFLSLGPGSRPDQIQSLEELAAAILRIQYTQPGGFEWKVPEDAARRLGCGPIAFSPIWAETREAALLAARRLDPQVEPEQIAPTELALSVLYTWGDRKTRVTSFVMRATPNYTRFSDAVDPPEREVGPGRTSP